MRAALPIAVSAGLGLALWTVAAQITHRAEPWDAPVFWSVFYPMAIALAGALGFAFPDRPWRWAVVVLLMLIPVMLAGGAGLGLLPLGVALLLVLSLPAAGLATAAAWVRRRL